jgi:hypothetical protein
VYDFLTFWVLLHVFHAGQTFFHTGLVRGVARHADPGALRDPNTQEPPHEVGATVTYLLLVEVAKRYLLGAERAYRNRVPIATPKL